MPSRQPHPEQDLGAVNGKERVTRGGRVLQPRDPGLGAQWKYRSVGNPVLSPSPWRLQQFSTLSNPTRRFTSRSSSIPRGAESTLMLVTLKRAPDLRRGLPQPRLRRLLTVSINSPAGRLAPCRLIPTSSMPWFRWNPVTTLELVRPQEPWADAADSFHGDAIRREQSLRPG